MASQPSLTRTATAQAALAHATGPAIALDDLDRRLLNLMQGSFPLAPRPYAAVAARGGHRRGRRR